MTSDQPWPHKVYDWLSASPWHIALVIAAVLALIGVRFAIWLIAARLRARLIYGRRQRPRDREHWPS